MTVSALTRDDTGSVLSWGTQLLTAGPGQTLTTDIDPDTFPQGEPNRYVKIVAGAFAAMSQPERDAVDALTAARSIQRVRKMAVVQATTSQADPGGGWVDVIPLVTAKPLLAGDYQLVCTFELGLVASSTTHTAQAQLLYNGATIAEWHNPYQPFQRCTLVEVATVATGDAPTFQLQVRRFGTNAGTAQARKALLVIAPVGQPNFDTAL